MAISAVETFNFLSRSLKPVSSNGKKSSNSSSGKKREVQTNIGKMG